jgi:hypothetical protein
MVQGIAADALLQDYATLKKVASHKQPHAIDRRLLWLSENKETLTEGEREELLALVGSGRLFRRTDGGETSNKGDFEASNRSLASTFWINAVPLIPTRLREAVVHRGPVIAVNIASAAPCWSCRKGVVLYVRCGQQTAVHYRGV